MKHLFASLLSALAISILSCSPVVAQDTATTNTAPPPAFTESVSGYFTKFNPSMTNAFSPSKKVDVRIGSDYASGVNFAATFGLSYKLPLLDKTNTFLSVESKTRNAGIAGTILSQDFEVGYNYVYVDTKISALLGGGYHFKDAAAYGAIGLRVEKALTDNTFAGIDIFIEPRKSWNKIPSIGIFTGFTF